MSNPSTQPTTILLLGAGAIGTFYASRLAQGGAQVSVICRSNYTAVKSQGFAFHLKTRTFGAYTFKPAHVFASTSEAIAARRRQEPNLPGWDFILVATKAVSNSGGAELLDGLLEENRTCIMLIQNGVGVEEPYRVRFPQTPILSAVTIAAAVQESPGTVVQNQWTKIDFGPYYYSTSTLEVPHASSSLSTQTQTRAHTLLDLFRRGSIRDATYHPSPLTTQQLRWHKLSINGSLSPTSVLTGGLTNAAMANDRELSTHLRATVACIQDLGCAVLGQPFPAHLASPDRILRDVARGDPRIRPSMTVDWDEGREMEVQAILGNAVTMARDRGIVVPDRLQALYALVQALQEGRRKKENKGKL